MKEIKKNIITELADADFLSFLYSERDREESLNSYQGWNIWVVIAALITVICTGYEVICENSKALDWLRIGYFLSGIIGFCCGFKGWFLLLISIWKRKRGIDIRRVKYLKDAAPIPYLVIATFCSLGFAVFFPLINVDNRWGSLSVLWIWMALAYVIICLNVYLGRDCLVQSYFDGITYPTIWLSVISEMIISVISWIICMRSFRQISGYIIGSPDFEIAIFIFAVTCLLYLFLKIVTSDKKASKIDELLDGFIYKDLTKESVYQQLHINRMGYDIVEACSEELYDIKRAFGDFEKEKKGIEEITFMLKNRTFEVERIPDYFNALQESLKYIKKCCKKVYALTEKLKLIRKQIPILLVNEEYTNLMFIAGAQVDKAKSLAFLVDSAINELYNCKNEYGCDKYGGLCSNKDCTHRHEKMSMITKIKFQLMRYSRRMRKRCNYR